MQRMGSSFRMRGEKIVALLLTGVVLLVALTAAFAALAQESAGGQTYTLVYGDTLDTIGQRFNVSVVSLQIANNLSPNSMLRPGMTIIIPSDGVPYGFYPPIFGSEGGGGGIGTVYVVQPRDIPDLIAAYFDVDLACLLQANDLTMRSIVFPGTALLIPEDCPPYSGFSSRIPGALRGLRLTPGVLSPAVTTTPIVAPTLSLVIPTQQFVPTQEVFTQPPTQAVITQIPATRGPTRTPTPEPTPAG